MAAMEPSDTASVTSDASTLATTASTAGNSAFSALRKAKSIAAQLRTVVGIRLEDLPPNVSDLPTITHAGKKYILERWIHKRQHRKSWVGLHGEWLVKLLDKDLKGSFWSYSHCNTLFNAQATSSAARHLRVNHGIVEEVEEGGPPRKKTKTVLELQKMGSIHGVKRAPVLQSTSQAVKESLISWIVDANVPFTMVENTHFRSLLSLLNLDLTQRLIPTGDTVRRWITEMYTRERTALQETLVASPYMKHVSFDLWTLPNSYGLLGVIVHFVDVNKTLQYRLLGLLRIRGYHGGENLAPALVRCVEDFGFVKRLGYWQLDNAESNDTCVMAVLRHFNTELTLRGISLIKRRCRVRCFGHIINLVVKAFLKGTNRDLLRLLTPGS